MPSKKVKKSVRRTVPAAKKSATRSAIGKKSKHEAARGLRVRPTTAAIDKLIRTTPKVDWDDGIFTTGAPRRRTGKTGSTVTTDDQRDDLIVLDAHDFFSRLKANWIGVDLAYDGTSQPTMLAPSIELTDQAGNTSIRLRKGGEFVRLGENGGKAGLWVGVSDALPGRVVVRAGNNEGRILLDSADSSISIRAPGGKIRGRLFPTPQGCALHLFDNSEKQFAYFGNFDGYSGLSLGGADRLPGRIVLSKGNYAPQIVLDADTGDIVLTNADCAEEFDVSDPAAEPGTVLVLDDKPGQLRPCAGAYDTRVAGVISGAGGYRPGIVLDRKGSRKGRRPIALVGKVFCRVEANSAPVRMGTLLTTSDEPGHAMAVTDRERAFGAVLGKALSGLDRGCGLIPVLVALQ